MGENWYVPLIGMVVLLAVSYAVAVFFRFLLSRVIAGAARRSPRRIYGALLQHGTLKWIGRLVPFIVMELGVKMVPGIPEKIAMLIDKVLFAIMVSLIVITTSSALSALEDLYRHSNRGERRLSLKGVLQLVKLIIFLTAILIVIGILTGKQIGLLLSGVGAMSAVLMLIFKDTILGLVAGVQLSTNDMLRIGDWITMPSAGADGDVVDITLNTVKVANFDHTIITIPTWKLITESYQNWRGMTESGGRRIKRALFLDATSVRFLTEQELQRLQNLKLLKRYLDEKRDSLDQWNQQLGEDGKWRGNRRQLTNLGTFRAYVANYLSEHPHIHRNMTCMVRQLPIASQGIPLELYCFTDTTTWIAYENIQSDLFDHLIAVLPEFDLRIYQQPSGFDMQCLLSTKPEPTIAHEDNRRHSVEI